MVCVACTVVKGRSKHGKTLRTSRWVVYNSCSSSSSGGGGGGERWIWNGR